MIHSLFVLNAAGEVIIEKHWRGNARRNDSLTFWGELVKTGNAKSLSPFLPTPRGALVHLNRAGLYFLASVLKDTQPLFVTTFLTTLANVLEDYFGELNEHAIKDNFITVYELLDEMLDNGYPLTMEPNTLKEVIAPPSKLNRVIESIGVEAPKASITQASPLIPWRRANVKYAQNEIFVDVVETVDAIISSTGILQHALIKGKLDVNCRLSGVPDLTMNIRCNTQIDDVAFHHCVRLNRYHSSGALSFVPPDGTFTLMSYVVRGVRALQPPIAVQARIDFDSTSDTGTVSISLHPRFNGALLTGTSRPSGSLMLAQVMSGKSIQSEPDSMMDDVSVTIPFGNAVNSAALSANYGTVQFDSNTGTCKWQVGTVPRGKTPSLIGNVTTAQKANAVVPPILLAFRIPGLAPSGMLVERLDMALPERYKYYKGLRCMARSGKYEVRM